MVTGIELGVVAVLMVVALVFARRILGVVKTLAGNAVGGVTVLLVAEWFGIGVALSPLAIAVSALVGVPGAILLVLLSLGGAGFVPSAGSINPATTTQAIEAVRHAVAAGQHLIAT